MSKTAASTHPALQGRLTSDAKELLDGIQRSGFPGWAALDIEGGRAAILQMKAFGGLPERVERVEDLRISRTDGSALSAALYLPESSVPLPILVYMHGGGFVLGDHTAVDALVRSLANRSGCAILSLDYRLAPEHKYPSALEDVQYALKWAVTNADQWGLQPDRLAVGGDSSGANLAAAASLLCRDQSGPTLAFQLLVYPPLNANYGKPSYQRFGDGSVSALSRADVVWFQNHYVNGADDLRLAYVSPLQAGSFADLPRTLLVLAEIDPLFDDGLEYARRLEEAGVPVDVQIYPGMFHGFWRMGGVLAEARQAIESAANVLRTAMYD